MIYGYIRISTDKQSMKNQEFEIQNFACRKNMKIDIWINEVISSTKKMKDRKLEKLLKKLKKGDILIASELSRLGRNLLQVMSILHLCMNKEVQVWTIKDNYRLGNDIQSKVLAFAFGLAAEIERNLISERTKSSLDRLKASGRKLGHPTGLKNKNHKLKGKKEQILKLLEKGMTRQQIARLMGVTRITLYTFLKSNL